jgi:hypothetical protein
LTYHILGDVISDPFAVDPVEPSDTEFLCPDLEGMFCYPGGIISADPFLWLDFLDQLPAVPDLSGTELQSALLGDWWSWYWHQQGNNAPPLSRNDSYRTNPGTPLRVDATGGLLSNDYDPDSTAVTVRILQSPLHGELSLKFDGSFDFQPRDGFSGVDTFVYEAYDFLSVSSPTTVTITVLGAIEGDLSGDGAIDATDLDLLAAALRSSGGAAFDLNGDQQLDGQDWEFLVVDILGTSFGDSNLDGWFDSADFVSVFQAGQYEDAVDGNGTWETGDWNGDGEFDSSDLVFVFQWGGYIT